MRRLEGADGDCFFCGEDQTNVASDPWWSEDRGRPYGAGWLAWLLCLACGRSNQLHADPP